MQKNNKNMKKLKDNSISIYKFLQLYYGIYNDDLFNIKITHDDIKKLLPYIKRTSFDKLLNNMQDLYTGKVVIVKDYFGNIVPYVTPLLFENEFIPVNIEISNKKESVVKEFIVNENLNTYELSLLCKKLKKQGKMREYKIAYNLLKSKKNSKVGNYKKIKEKTKMKGIEI